MIISRTPFRISFAGGGSDLKEYYRHSPGAVTSTAINKYMYVTVNKRFEKTVRVSYSKTEIVENADQLNHELIRAAMKKTGVTSGVEITTIADVPAKSGLGSSSSLTVGVLNALYAFQGKHRSPEQLAREACEIEIDIVKEPIGKQDQYAAAYGGLNYIRFNSDETVDVQPVSCTKDVKEELSDSLLMFYLGAREGERSILKEQSKKTHVNLDTIGRMAALAGETRKAIESGDLSGFGRLLHEGWEFKKKLASGISNPRIDDIYGRAQKAGALGGKVLGEGGGGFVLLYCEKSNQQKLRESLADLSEFEFAFEPFGSRIIYVGD
ncbi:MAG: GHMP kinase [Candidatus Altiarchaeota archaeon]|nr:GHMP kinase [Candidatus Altiarchaeota archaeon]